MKVKMESIAAGPDGVFNIGKVYDLPEKQAQAFITGKYAVAYVASAKAKAPAAEVKTLIAAKLAHKAAKEAFIAGEYALKKADKKDKPAAGKALDEAQKALKDAEKKVEELEAE